ncbi:hypothetical protein ACS0TY_005351 [Phlomoides rotata]
MGFDFEGILVSGSHWKSINMHLNSRNMAEISLVLEAIRRRTLVVFVFGFAILWWNKYVLGRRRSPRRFNLLDSMPRQIRSLHDLVDANDDDCKDALRMDRVAFSGLCDLLQTISGLRNSKYIISLPTTPRIDLSSINLRGQDILCQSIFIQYYSVSVSYIHSSLLNLGRYPMTALTRDGKTIRLVSGVEHLEGYTCSKHVYRMEEQSLTFCYLSAVSKMDGSGSGGLGDGKKGKNVRSRRSWTKIEEDALVLCLIEIGWIPTRAQESVGLNCTTHTLDVTDEGVWEAQKKADPHVKGMRFKYWPYYEQWQDIFGRDRVTGEHAAAAIDIMNDMLSIKRKPVETEMTALVSTLGQFMKSSDDTFGSIAQKMGNEQ